jgi:hypothetical protein
MKKTKILSVLLLCLTLSVFNCSGSDDNDTEEEFSLIVIAGPWSGTFDGGDSGTYSVIVSTDGTVAGTAFSNDLQQNLALNGTIDDDGNLDAVVGSAANGASFTGKFRATTSSGTWNNPNLNLSGTWTGIKDEQ